MMITNTQKVYQRQQGSVKPLLLAKLVLLVLLSVWLLSLLLELWQVLKPTTEEAPVQEVGSVASRETNALPAVDIAKLQKIALFGDIVAAPVAVVETKPKEEKIEETQLNLLLKGLFAASEAEQGQAIIANGRREGLYHVGDVIEGLSEVRLSAVFIDRINLNNRGKSEVLYLYPESERVSPSGGTQGSAQDYQSKPPPFSERDADSGARKLNEVIRVVRERDRETGNMLGFRVLPGRNRDAFEGSGLKVNDVITAMDGEALTDLRSAMAVYRAKREATEVSLTILRAGSELTVHIDLNQ